MNRAEYLNRLIDNIFEQDIMPIFDFFEPHLSEPKIADHAQILTIRANMIDQGIKNIVSCLNKNLYSTHRGVLRSYCNSLFTNVRQFENMDYTTEPEKIVQKWKVLLLSYINLSRLIIDDEKIQRFFEQPDDFQNIILCLSTIKLEEDDIRANQEIVEIQETINQNPNDTYLVLPFHGCSFDRFKNQMKKYNTNITHVHIAGHATTSQVRFSDSGVKYETLCKHIEQHNCHFRLLFLNCCFTYEYLKQTAFPHAQTSICHETSLISETAIDASRIFYGSLVENNSIDDSWAMVQNSIEDDLYHVLPSNAFLVNL